MEEWYDMSAADPSRVKKERERARELRRTQWWKARIASGVCHYCGRNVGPENLTLDHIIPISRGGTSTKGNCVPACKDCNSKKQSTTPAEQILAKLFPEG